MTKKTKIPSYLLHKPTGQARVRIDGRDFYLGEYGSEQSHVRYGEMIARHAGGLPPLSPARKSSESEVADTGPCVAELIVAFRNHAKEHYVKNGEETSEVLCYDSCLRILRELYGFTPAKDFGPLALKAVREKMIAGDPDAKDGKGNPLPRKPWARSNINVMIGRIRRVFKYAVECEMIDVSVYERLKTVSPLLKGRPHGAHDNKKRTALHQSQIDAVASRVQPLVRDLIELQLATGTRPGELLKLTSGIIDRTGPVWKTVLNDHKTAHHGLTRMIPFGPKAQAILSKYLTDDPDAKLFSITRCAYCRAITRVCDELKIDRWTPHWLRHTYVTRTREKLGRDAAQAVAGHTTGDMTEEYSHMENLACETAAAVG